MLCAASRLLRTGFAGCARFSPWTLRRSKPHASTCNAKAPKRRSRGSGERGSCNQRAGPSGYSFGDKGAPGSVPSVVVRSGGRLLRRAAAGDGGGTWRFHRLGPDRPALSEGPGRFAPRDAASGLRAWGGGPAESRRCGSRHASGAGSAAAGGDGRQRYCPGRGRPGRSRRSVHGWAAPAICQGARVARLEDLPGREARSLAGSRGVGFAVRPDRIRVGHRPRARRLILYHRLSLWTTGFGVRRDFRR